MSEPRKEDNGVKSFSFGPSPINYSETGKKEKDNADIDALWSAINSILSSLEVSNSTVTEVTNEITKTVTKYIDNTEYIENPVDPTTFLYIC